MCGIIGYVGSRTALPLVLEGLKNLEYRGYDSAGIAVISNDQLRIKKDVGRVDRLLADPNFNKTKGVIGIGHTRWATHGKVCVENAHPHTDCTEKIAIVHNGILENFRELKSELLKREHIIRSETDSELIAHIIEEYLKIKPTFLDAFSEALKRLEGSYAILAIKADEKVILGAKKSSPLVLGVSEHGIFISSDIPSFLEHTKNVVYFHDGDIVKASPDGFNVFSNEAKVHRPIDTIDWDVEQVKKGDFDHFMLKEIMEQTETIQRAIQQDKAIIEQISEAFKSAKGIFFVGCGSSYHACLVGSYVFSKISNLHVNVCLGSEFENFEHFLTPETLVVAISQSGETADTLGAVRVAKKKGCKILTIVNVMGSSLMREGEVSLLLKAGPEMCVLSTKTYTSQVALLTLLAFVVADRLEDGKNEMKKLWLEIYKLTSRTMKEHIRKLAHSMINAEHVYLIGRGLQYTTALEAALKIKEVSYIHAEAFAGGELKHGTLALIEEGTPCIVFVSGENNKIIQNIHEIKSRGGVIIGVSPQQNEIFDFWIKVPEVGLLSSIIQIIPIQILSYYLAVLKGLDPDRPRHLAKSVTVE
ncbi:MAG: glutamine--fructose-6-phosphate transaminase (isomerizing) [Methanocellales archaeon]|nr:glutamine--fructose-6-phosphate transaminase (isomerizing) [Methanocellales archaeon]